MKRILITAALVLPLAFANAQYVFANTTTSVSGDTASLKAIHQKYMQAWTDRDLDTISEDMQ